MMTMGVDYVLMGSYMRNLVRIGWALRLLAIGCLLILSRPALAADAVKTPTFTKDVAPIFQSKCESCHRADSMAPMSLVTYEEARPWAKSIATRVRKRQM